MAHTHGGRQFAPNLHTKFGYGMMVALTVDIVTEFALFLKPNALQKLPRFKCAITWTQYLLDKVIVVAGWGLMVNGGLTALEFCSVVQRRGTQLSNCLQHSIYGLAFLGHGVFWVIMLQQAGRSWLIRNGRSLDFYDSLHFLFWGVVNVVAEHNWLDSQWVHVDIEHTSTGMLYVAGGLLSVWLTWRRSPSRPARSPMLGIVVFISGWTLTTHRQSSEWATGFHRAVGCTMMALGVTKILEISLILKDKAYLSAKEPIDSFQYVPIAV